MVLVSKSTFDLVSLRKLSPNMRECVSDDTTIAEVVHTFWSKSMSTGQFPVCLMFRQCPRGVYNEIRMAWPGD